MIVDARQVFDEMLQKQYKERGITVWEPASVYPTAILGNNVSVGKFAEVGNYVKVGDNTRIGKGAFIPEGVTIEEDVFIGPHACFTNDPYPPGRKENWRPTLVKKGAAIGANATIVCGVTIGEGALIGAGSVVTRDVGDHEQWSGVPARKMKSIRRG